MPAHITGAGRLIVAPEIKFTTSGQRLTSLRIAVDHSRKKEGQKYPDSDVYSVEVWGERAETAVNHLQKGQWVYFNGRLETSQGQDGRTFLNVKNGDWAFTGGKRQERDAGDAYDADVPF